MGHPGVVTYAHPDVHTRHHRRIGDHYHQSALDLDRHAHDHRHLYIEPYPERTATGYSHPDRHPIRAGPAHPGVGVYPDSNHNHNRNSGCQPDRLDDRYGYANSLPYTYPQSQGLASPTPIAPEPTLAAGTAITLELRAPEAVLPGESLELGWASNASELLSSADKTTSTPVLVLAAPKGWTPQTTSGSFDALSGTLTQSVTAAEAALTWQVPLEATGPFTLTAVIELEGKAIVSRTLTIAEEGLNYISSTGGVAEGLGGNIKVHFSESGTLEELEVRVRRLLPRTATIGHSERASLRNPGYRAQERRRSAPVRSPADHRSQAGRLRAPGGDLLL